MTFRYFDVLSENSDIRIIFHIDFDYFFAQCEEIRNPSIKNFPVIVCVYSGRTSDSGVVSTSNYVARKYGVKSGISIREAKLKLSSVDNPVFLSIDQKYYSEISNKAMNIIKSVVDKCEIVGLDECYVELTEFLNGDFSKAVEIAQMLKTKLYEKIHISCSIGISYNKLLAKIGSKYQKPSGLFLMEPKKSINFISDLDISLIPRIGPKNKKKLHEMGIKTFKDISIANTDMLKKEFGSACSNYLCNSARGINYDPVKSDNNIKQIVRIKTLKENSHDVEYFKFELHKLCNSILEKLTQRNLLFKTLALIFISETLEIKTKSRTLRIPSQDPHELFINAEIILNDFISANQDVHIRRLGIKVLDLKDKSGQSTLLNFIE